MEQLRSRGWLTQLKKFRKSHMEKMDEMNLEYDRKKSRNRRSLLRSNNNLCDVDIDDSVEKSTTAMEKLKHRGFCHGVIAGFLVTSKTSECEALTFGCRRPR